MAWQAPLFEDCEWQIICSIAVADLLASPYPNNLKTYILKHWCWGAWVAPWVERVTLGFHSGHDVAVVGGIEPRVQLCAQRGICMRFFLGLPLPLPVPAWRARALSLPKVDK